MMQHTPKQSSGLADNEQAYGDVSVLVRNTGSGFKVQSTILCSSTSYSTYKNKSKFSQTVLSKFASQVKIICNI